MYVHDNVSKGNNIVQYVIYFVSSHLDSYSRESIALRCLAQLFKCSENLLFDEIEVSL